MTVSGWKLEAASREFLVDIFPPRWPDLVGEHVTLDSDASLRHPLPPKVQAAVIGHADDGEGLEALVVEINGETARPDDSVFHITWSLDRGQGRKPAESNTLLAKRGWRSLAAPIAIDLTPARL